jgi:hypothetical protein
MNSVAFLESTWNDVRHSLRMMRKNLAFTLTAIATLAIGIGGNTAIFSMIRAVLLKPLAYRAPDRLVYLTVDHPRKNQFDMQFQLICLEHMRKAHSFSGLDVWFSKPSEWSVLPPRYWDLSLVQGFGRLKPHVSLEQALAEIGVLDHQYLSEYRGLYPGEMRVVWLKDRLVKNVPLMVPERSGWMAQCLHLRWRCVFSVASYSG